MNLDVTSSKFILIFALASDVNNKLVISHKVQYIINTQNNKKEIKINKRLAHKLGLSKIVFIKMV